ncbi:hypothetical protein PCS70012_02328, partial [Streptococcus pneumoniae PCS70012]
EVFEALARALLLGRCGGALLRSGGALVRVCGAGVSKGHRWRLRSMKPRAREALTRWAMIARPVRSS